MHYKRLVMKKLFILISLLTLSATASATDQSFNATLKLIKPITITKIQDLLFPDGTAHGSAYDMVVATGDAGAATFNAKGGKGRNLARSVVESSVILSDGGGQTLTVNTFVVAGPTAFDGFGDANGLKVGATLHVLASSHQGTYSGSATFRVVYQ